MDRAQVGRVVGGAEERMTAGTEVADDVLTYNCLGGGADDSRTPCSAHGDIEAPIRPFDDDGRDG